ncbi:hypothetical protein DV736_g6279, partial [Chaetothyriales sp. CBS 134916]
MEALPRELIAHICSCLPRADLRAFRLSCKAYGSIGLPYLFQDFEFRLWPSYHRLYQLEQLAANPDIAVRLQGICFESGVQLEYADYRYWQAQLCHEISSNWARAHAVNGTLNDDYEEFHSLLQARFTPDMPQKYLLYRWHLDQEAASVAHRHTGTMLRRILDALHQHQPAIRFKLVMTEPKITLEHLEQFNVAQYQNESPEDLDLRRRVHNRRMNCIDHFVHFLDATTHSNYGTRHLTAINLPHALLAHNHPNVVVTLQSTFRSLQKLDIKPSSFPHSERLSRGRVHDLGVSERNGAANHLLDLLDQSTNLDHLRLEFPDGEEVEYSSFLFDPTHISHTPRLWMLRLKSLSLSTFRCSWPNLAAFLGICNTLESLTLSSCRLQTGSMIDLLHFVPSMVLRHVAIEGTWYCDVDLGKWHSHTPEDFNMCVAATTYEGPYVHTGIRSRVEKFMLKGGKCPLPTRTADEQAEDIWEAMGDTSWHYLPFLAQPH